MEASTRYQFCCLNAFITWLSFLEEITDALWNLYDSFNFDGEEINYEGPDQSIFLIQN